LIAFRRTFIMARSFSNPMSAANTISRYEVQKREDGAPFELGKDSVGVTYKAFDSELERFVALKVIDPTAIPNRDAEDIFVREATSAMGFRHPYIAAFFDWGRNSEGTHFCVTELCEGRTLQNLVEEEGSLAWRRALEVAACAADALAAAAEMHLVHGDLRPSNLILQRQNEMFTVIGFGQVKPSAGEIPGALAFASPERIQNKIVDIRSDIYSLGAMLWFMLVGSPPGVGSLSPDVPETVAILIQCMLDSDPDMRPQTADGLLDNINVCLYAERKRSPSSSPAIHSKPSHSNDDGDLQFAVSRPEEVPRIKRDRVRDRLPTIAKPKAGKGRLLAIPFGVAAAVALTFLIVSTWINSHKQLSEVRKSALVRGEPQDTTTAHSAMESGVKLENPSKSPALLPLGTPPPADPKPSATAAPKAQRDPGLANTGATWRTYAPGHAPPGKVVRLDDAAALADRNAVGKRLYLQGDFRVTASNPSRAILRDANKPDDQFRVVVEYPSSIVAPGEGERISRDASHPYQVFNIRRAADGVVTIWAKEITQQ
jgi:serine/threonine protein kinase